MMSWYIYKVEGLDSKLAAADAALKEKEEEFARTASEKEQAAKVEKSAKEDLEVKVRAQAKAKAKAETEAMLSG